MPDLFVSYAREDESVIRRLDAALADRGLETWVDWDILPTAQWRPEIEAAIAASDAFLAALSPDSLRSPECRRELARAGELGKRIVPLVVRPVEPDDTPEAVRSLNWIFCRPADDFDATVDTVCRALALDIGWVHDHTRLLVRALDWQAHDHDRSLLLRGRDLLVAEEWLARSDRERGLEPTAAQVDFLVASRQAATSSTRVRIALLSIALVVALVLATVAFLQRNEARHQQQVAQGREYAANSLAALPTDPELSLWFASRSAETASSVQADALIRQALLESRIRVAYRVPGAPDHPSYQVVAVGPDLRTEVVGSTAEGLDVRPVGSARTGTRLELPQGVTPKDASRWSATYDPSSGEIATNGAVYSARTGNVLHRLAGATAPTFSADGTRLVDSVAKGVDVWDATGTLVASLPISGGLTPVLNRNGTQVLTWESCDGCNELPVVTDVASGRRLYSLGDASVIAGGAANPNAPHALLGTAPTTAAAFSPDGAYIVTGDGAGVVRVWLTSAPQVDVAEFHDHTGAISSLEFSADGKRVLSGSGDGTARVFELATGRSDYYLRGHTGPVARAQFATGDDRVATIGDDQTVRVWDTSVFRAQDSPLPPLGATNSQVDDDGRLVLTSDRAGDATVYALPNGRPRFSFRARTRVTTSDPSASYVVDAALSADGRRVVDAAPAGVGVVWDVDSARQVTRLQGHGDIFRAPALDARGDRAATVGPDAVRIWDTGSGELLETLSVTAPGTVALDRGGDTVVVVNAAGASTWDAGTGDRLATLAGTGDVFRSVRFDPAGDRVAAVGADGNARVWDAHTGAIIRTGFGTASSQAIGKRYDAVFADFSADGRQLVTIASGGVLRVWDAESGRLLAEPPAVTVSNQLGVTLAALTRDRGHVVVALGTSISRYPCTVCATTPELVRRARTAVSRYVARHAQTLLEQ